MSHTPGHPASGDTLTLPLPFGAPRWFEAYHNQLYSLLQRQQFRVDKQAGLRGQSTLSSELDAYGNVLKGVGAPSADQDAVNKAALDATLSTFGPAFVQEPHVWGALQTFQLGIRFAGAETLLNYTSTPFTMTGTGYGTPPEGAALGVQLGHLVLVSFPDLFETSNDVGLTLTGLPAALTPQHTAQHVVRVRDNGVDAVGVLLLTASDTTFTVLASMGGAGWTAAGSKGIYGTTVAYLV